MLPEPEAKVPDFAEFLSRHSVDLAPLPLTTLQMNITKLCNQACMHCHVDASPRRREMMSAEVLAACLDVARRSESIREVDITGGAPELHPEFRSLVRGARRLKKKVIVRHNLTVTLDPHPVTGESLHDLPEFFAGEQVEVVSSLPYYQEFFTDKQRGDGVFTKSIESLKMLNAVGFGREGTGLVLGLVYNPVGAFLPPNQASLEADYKRELAGRFGIHFNRLYTLTNMPIHRFAAQLKRLKTYEEYLERLARAFNPMAAAEVMCRTLLSVGYDGRLYDCDFNQMLGLPVEGSPTIFGFNEAALLKRKIRLGQHCFGCTAGSGSSCGGATVD